MNIPQSLKTYLQSSENSIKEFIPIDPYNDHPKFFHFTAIYKPSDTSRTYKMEPNGLSPNKNEALIKTAMEAIERYALVDQSHSHPIKGSFIDLQKKCKIIDPVFFFTPLISQKTTDETLNMLRQTPLLWSEVTNEYTNKKAFIPTQVVHLLPKDIKEPHLRLQDTTGTAAGFTEEDAILQALYEVIERESFSLFFYTQTRRNRLLFDNAFDVQITELLSYIKSYDFNPCIIDMTTDTQVPSISCWLFNNSPVGPRVVVGVSAHSDKKKAIYKAILECIQSLTNCRNMLNLDTVLKKKQHKRPYIDRASIRNMLYWAEEHKDQQTFLSFLSSLPPVTVHAEKSTQLTRNNELKKVLIKLKKAEINHVFSTNIAPYLLKYGIFIMRVVIPECIPLSLSTPYDYRNVSRMYSIPHKMGLQAIQKHQHFTSIPHPFP